MASTRRLSPGPTREQSYAQRASLGISKEFARRDHTHGTPPFGDRITLSTGEGLKPKLSDNPDGTSTLEWEVVA